MAKITFPVATTTNYLSTFNQNFVDIAAELQNKILYRDNPVGETNTMENVLDMNGNRVFNLPAPSSPSDAARLQDIIDATAGIVSAASIPFVPSGTISSTNVQAAIQELDNDNTVQNQALTNHIVNPTGAHQSSAIGFTQSGTGAVLQTAQAQLREHVSVKNYGAVGDGIVNDAPFIQAAIDANVGTIYLPPGTYKLDTGLSWTKSGVRLVGAGMGVTTLSSTFINGDIINVGTSITNPNNAMISDLSINSSVPKLSGAAIRFQNGHSNSIERVRLDGNMFIGFQFDGGPQQFIYKATDFEINSGSIGILVGQTGGPVQDLFLTRGVVFSCTDSGLYLLDASGINCMHLDFVQCKNGLTTFPGVGQSAKYLFFTQVVMDTCTQYGWFISANGGFTGEATLTNCWGASCTFDGIFIGTSSGAVRAIGVNGSRFIGNQQNGIHLGNSLQVTFSNCQVIANSQSAVGVYHGLGVDANVSSWSVIGGVYGNNGWIGAANNQGYGIFVAAGTSTNYVIEGALVTGNTTGGISDGGSGATKYIAGNPGYTTNSQGTATIGVGSNNVAVNHNLSVTPAVTDIQLTFASSSVASSITSCFVGGVSATQISITTNANVAGTPLVIGWSARVKGA